MCFLTNGGGVTEAQKAEQLSKWLDVSVGEDQVWPQLSVQSCALLSVRVSSACMPALLLFVQGSPGLHVPALLMFGAILLPKSSVLNLPICKIARCRWSFHTPLSVSWPSSLVTVLLLYLAGAGPLRWQRPMASGRPSPQLSLKPDTHTRCLSKVWACAAEL